MSLRVLGLVAVLLCVSCATAQRVWDKNTGGSTRPTDDDRWADAGFTKADAKAWRRAGAMLSTAKSWRAAGFKPEEGIDWATLELTTPDGTKGSLGSQMLKQVWPNSTWSDGALQVSFKEPFDILAEFNASLKKENPTSLSKSGVLTKWLRICRVIRTACICDSNPT